MEIRNETICYSKRKRQEITLQQKIDKLHQEICNSGALNPSLLDSYEEAKNELKEIYDLRAKPASGAPLLRKYGNLSIREILVVT